MSVLNVSLGERSYPLVVERDVVPAVLRQVSALAAEGRKIAVVTDASVARCQAEALRAMFGAAPTLIVEPGERAKSLTEFGRVMDFLAANKIDRGGTVWAVGGGVVGDLAGFAAAAWLRGVDLFQLPTTLLAMVDSSVGGKTGINIAAGKNLVGAFHQPRGVFIGTDFLRTLPAREFAAGAAEIIKYGLLGDAEMFAALEREPLRLGSVNLGAVIERCCAQKAAIVAADERELAKEGGRALLNLGHTFGHAIEQVAGYGDYLHGEAVAIGLCAAARLSQKLGYIGAGDVARVDAVVAAHGLPTRLRAALPMEALFAAMARDKKVRSGALRFVVLKKLGEAMTEGGVDARLAEEAFGEVGAG
jgi:3-dehydroquinate synthase